jgi:hypothetical protein
VVLSGCSVFDQASGELMDATAATAKPKSKITVARVVLWVLVALIAVWFFAARSGKSVSSAIAGPTTIKDERVQLKEGAWKGYGFTVPASRKIEVHVSAAPKSVDVVTVSRADYDQFSKAHKALFGGQYKYIPSLSSRNVTKYDGQAILAQGEWYVVVMRPQQSLLFGDDTDAQVKILAY